MFERRLAWAALRTALLCLALSPLTAAADDSWIGRQVFWKDGARAKIGTREIAIENVPFPAIVEAVEGPWLWLGRAWVQKSDVMFTQQALDYYSGLVQREPADSVWWRRRGAVRATQGDWPQAIADYTKAIQTEPGNAAAFNNRGVAYSTQGDRDKAIADFSEAIRLDPRRASYYNSRGVTLDELGQQDQAIADYDKAIQLDPAYVMAYNNRGAAWIGKGDYHKAIDDYTAAIALDAKYLAAYENRGAALSRQGQYEQAIKDFNQAIAIDPSNAAAFFNRGLARSRAGRFAAAIDDYNHALEINPDSTDARNGRAWLRATCALAQYRDGAQAVEDATALCKLTDWKLPEALDTLAASYAEAGDFPAAIKWERQALELADKSLEPDMRQHLTLFQAGQAYHSQPMK